MSEIEQEVLHERLSKIERMLEDFLEALGDILQKPKKLDRLKVCGKHLQAPRSDSINV
jgi:hypothetical protein